ncbi:UDP-2,3-diacylglucosamine diphosphatase [Flavobacterium bizetiae]|uniref:UDP-2,3-diacylglucosamine hydrolase n=1 Tax=Flavobacterium bizetiae TaxID=2704140 RepID=A0A6J4GQZ0_9FLAO|nr:UDP-2,3-diacylglucosamine diphosphatase [Flavobacterium bizetiae]UTN03679.1 UDP-2,3-diacylglucosamine diphosphatase [Flavobacterium bizetiae]CAA9201675.1 UDP-2,3-diacylglucosamine hydrolase [Flavobacterium bizetiae]CAD5343776.1 UDP-2,3-diacylglucosamine hydrolase [Flavobacterium bizetiae]CAD5350007.1 UDP-2,3-diacylglucosamine hydrolase [Flavobacterium bizetiae]
MKKRNVELVILSDVHLGTYGSHAKELNNYLSSIKPKTLVLNGDIIDAWQFRKSYFPKAHLRVIQRIIGMASKGTKVYYITGNHDEILRKFSDMNMGNFSLVDKLVLELDDKKAWIFHGDVFDASVQHSKWIAKLGGLGYDYLILSNRFANWCLTKLGREPYSFSKKIKASVKKAVKFISDFETTATDLAIEKKYDYVICGHIHEPKIITKENKNGSTLYLNSGDWVENLTALEYHKKRWKLYSYTESNFTEEENLFEMEDILTSQLISSIILKK